MVVWESNFDYESLSFQAAPRRRGFVSRPGVYADVIASFDIETSRFAEIEQSVMYIWQFCLDYPDGHSTVILGRTWTQFKRLLQRLQAKLCNKRLIIYVMNLSYEFQFLTGIYNFRDDEVFCLESRSILYATMYKNFEFRCAYKLFNMGLSEATAKYAPDYHKKDGGQFGYDERRFYDTPLTRKQLLYCVYDVWGLCKAVRALFALFDDDVYTVPLTSTGFVRRETKRVMRPNHFLLKELWPDIDVYKLERIAFRGGNTHGSRYYAGEIIENARGRDLSSSYPRQQCTKQYPMTAFKKRVNLSLSAIERRIDHGEALLIHAKLYHVELRNKYTAIPYLPIAKCVGPPHGVLNDNGRILRCSECEIVVTDIDWKIIVNMYSFSCEIIDLYSSWYDYLPEELIALNQRYYREKTELKGVEGQELYYMKSKNLLNSIYGMSVMDPVRARILYNHGLYTQEMDRTQEDILKVSGKNPYTVYQWGVWTTAHARDDLQRGIDICGDRLIYVDTDSCKYVGDCDFSEYNAEAVRIAKDTGSFAVDPKGKTHYMGVFEEDGVYNRFITLGAKKYAYEDEKGKLHITVAGVPKIKGATELEEAGGLEAFKPGFVFSKTGKLESVYNDGTIRGVEIDGHVIDCTNNVVLRPTTYKLDVTTDYASVIKSSKKVLNAVHKLCGICRL